MTPTDPFFIFRSFCGDNVLGLGYPHLMTRRFAVVDAAGFGWGLYETVAEADDRVAELEATSPGRGYAVHARVGS